MSAKVQYVYLCLCYFSPKESTFSKRNNDNLSVLEMIEQDLARFSTDGKAIITGDLNAHINPERLCGKRFFISKCPAVVIQMRQYII